MRRVIALLIPLLLAVVVPAKAAGEDDARQRRLTYYYLAAQQQKLQGNYTSWIELLRHCLRIDPENAAANYEYSLALQALQQDSAAAATLQRAVDNDPQNPWFLESLATAKINNRQVEEGIELLERITKIQTKRTDVLSELFGLYKSERRTAEAIHVLDRIATLQGNTQRIATQKYALYLEQGDTAKAVNEIKKVCAEFPYDATSHLLLGDQYLALGMPDSALAAYDQAERIDPHSTLLQASRLQYPLALGDTATFRHMRDSVALTDEAELSLRVNAIGSMVRDALADSTQRPNAEAVFERLLSPDKPPVEVLQLWMAYLSYIRHATVDDLLPIMERILYIDPSNLTALRDVLQIYVDKLDYTRIQDLCQKAIVYHPSELIFHYFLGATLYQQKKYQEAVNSLSTAIRQVTPNEPSAMLLDNSKLLGDTYSVLGDIKFELGDKKGAYAAYDSCLVYAPDNVSCLNNYAYYLSLEEDELAKAEQMSYRTIRAEPTNKTYLDTYAWVLFVQGDYTTARIYMDRVIDPTLPDSVLRSDTDYSTTVLEHAGDIYANIGDTDTALRLWQLALEKTTEKNALLRKKIKKKKKYLKK
ncbi:MAG: tetratricopeptide repeat protein [Bacteroidales bacterium]|nr:tetratricopeptide repeat protein [Candidatus Physcousia equi]